MKCKNLFGRKLCKFGSGAAEIMEFPQNLSQNVEVGIYTDKNCTKVCNPEINNFLKSVKPVRDLLDIKIYDFSENPDAFNSGILKLPTFTIGKNILDSRATDSKIIRAIRDAIPESEL